MVMVMASTLDSQCKTDEDLRSQAKVVIEKYQAEKKVGVVSVAVGVGVVAAAAATLLLLLLLLSLLFCCCCCCCFCLVVVAAAVAPCLEVSPLTQ